MLHAARKYALHQLWGKYTGTSPTLAKRCTCTLTVAASKESGFSAASAAKPKPAFFVVGQRDKDTLLAIIHAHILPGKNVMSDLWRALIRLPKSEPQPKLTKLFVVLLYALLVIRLFATSWRRETKYTAVLLHGTEFGERNQGEKMRRDAIEVSSNFIS